jgi:hypothetical protein
MSMRIHYSFRERAGLIGGLSVATVTVVGLVTASNWQPGLVDDFRSPYSSIISEIDGILPSGLVVELVAESPALAAAGGFVSAETQGRSTELPVNAEGLVTGEPPSSLGADAPFAPPTVGAGGGRDVGQPGTPGGAGGAPGTPAGTTSPTPTPTTTQSPPAPAPTTDPPPPDPEPTTDPPPPDPEPTTDPPPPDPEPTTDPPPDPEPTTDPPPDPEPTTDPPPPTGPTSIEIDLPPLF